MPVSAVSVPPAIQKAITSAGNRSGVDFDYLLTTAMRESSLNPNAKAPTSSATGLFQFLSSTWLETVKEEGPGLGYGDIAKHIQKTGSHHYEVRDPTMRAKILAMRKEPQMASDMAAAFTRKNGDYLAQAFDRQPSPGELYIAHFMGARGAEQFFKQGLKQPDANAAQLFPRQAKANPAIFYNKGEPRTVREVYKVLTGKHRALGVQPSVLAAQQMAQAQPQTPAQPPLVAVNAPQTSPVANSVLNPAVHSAYAGTLKTGIEAGWSPQARVLMSLPGHFAAPPNGDAFSLFSAQAFASSPSGMTTFTEGNSDELPPPAPRILMTDPPETSEE